MPRHSIFVLAIGYLLNSSPLLAQPAGDALPHNISPLLHLAQQLGRAAGDAEYCAFDEDAVEDFIARSMARLAKETKDQALLAGSRIEFNNHAAHGRASGPDEGCEAFALSFATIRRQLD